MLELNIEKNKSTPEIVYDHTLNKLTIRGRSVLKNMDDDFYAPVYQLLKEAVNNNEGIIVEFSLDYFNTSSHPSLIKIFELTSKVENSILIWWYESNDLEMMEIGSELQRYSPMPIQVKLINS